MITIILARFPLSSEQQGLRMCHWDPEPLACTKTSSAQFCYSLPDQTGLKLLFETISLYLVSR